MMRRSVAAAFFVLALGVLLPGVSQAQAIRFTRIVSEGTSVPGGYLGKPAVFETFRSASIDGNRVVFSGEYGAGSGLFLSLGGSLSPVVTSETRLPDDSGFFGRFYFASIDGDQIAFIPRAVGGNQGVFLAEGDSFVKVADASTPVPGGSGPFTGFIDRAFVDAGKVLFSPGTGLYVWNGGGIQRLADQQTPPAGHPVPLLFFRDHAFDQGNAAFRGYESNDLYGIYLVTPSQTFEVARRWDPAPGADWQFNDFRDVSIGGTDVAFVAADSSFQNQAAVYLWSGGTLTTLADFDTFSPGTSDRFDHFFFTSVSQGNVAFMAKRTGDKRGIYVWSRGQLVKVIAQGDTIDGRTVHSLLMDPEAFSGSRIVFTAITSPGGQAVYVADLGLTGAVEVPTLGSAALALLVLALAAAAVLRLRRAQRPARPVRGALPSASSRRRASP